MTKIKNGKTYLLGINVVVVTKHNKDTCSCRCIHTGKTFENVNINSLVECYSTTTLARYRRMTERINQR